MVPNILIYFLGSFLPYKNFKYLFVSINFVYKICAFNFIKIEKFAGFVIILWLVFANNRLT